MHCGRTPCKHHGGSVHVHAFVRNSFRVHLVGGQLTCQALSSHSRINSLCHLIATKLNCYSINMWFDNNGVLRIKAPLLFL